MWISELSRRTDVPVATIKYYLREGLLPPGEAAGATRAVYDDSHERRLRLIRARVTRAGRRADGRTGLAGVRRRADARRARLRARRDGCRRHRAAERRADGVRRGRR